MHEHVFLQAMATCVQLTEEGLWTLQQLAEPCIASKEASEEIRLAANFRGSEPSLPQDHTESERAGSTTRSPMACGRHARLSADALRLVHRGLSLEGVIKPKACMSFAPSYLQ